MKGYPQKHRKLYQTEWNKAVNRFEREFLNNLVIIKDLTQIPGFS